MSNRSWRILATLLGLATLVLWWQNCGLRGQRARLLTQLEAVDARAASRSTNALRDRQRDDEPPPPPRSIGEMGAELGLDRVGLAELAWLADTFGMRADEDLLDYRDRVVPIVTELIEPQRQRVQRNRAAFASEAGVDADRLDMLDELGTETASALRDRVVGAVMGGEIMPPFRPERMVHFARDVLDMVDDTAQRFRAGLTSEQLDALDAGRFDVVDYLLFSIRWEDLLELP